MGDQHFGDAVQHDDLAGLRLDAAEFALDFPGLSTPDGASNRCESISVELAERIGGQVARVTGLAEMPTLNPLGASTPAALEHHVVVKDGWVLDMTARQYEPDAEFPLLTSTDEFFSRWNDVEIFDI